MLEGFKNKKKGKKILAYLSDALGCLWDQAVFLVLSASLVKIVQKMFVAHGQLEAEQEDSGAGLAEV